MIKETLNLVGRLDLAPEAIVLLDGDALEINIIRDGQRMTLLNLAHFAVDDAGAPIPIDPLAIQISIETAKPEEQGSEASEALSRIERNNKLSPRRKGQRSKKLASGRRVQEKH